LLPPRICAEIPRTPARLAATAKDIGDLGKRLITPAAIAVLVFR
jgi:hypothetical protein